MSFPRSGLIKNTMLWSISEWFPFPFHCQKHQRIFLPRLLCEPCWDTAGKCHNICGPSRCHGCVLLEFFQLSEVTTPSFQQSIIYSSGVLPGTGSCSGFSSWVGSGKPGLPVFAGRSLCPSLTGQRRVTNFSVCLSFYLLEQNGIFQDSCRWNQMFLSLLSYKIGTMTVSTSQRYDEDWMN